MKLFTVGPVEMYPETLKTAGKQLPYFRTDEFSEVMFDVERSLKRLMNSKEDSKAIVITGSGSSAMEAVVADSLDQSDRVLVINGGSFGARFVRLCEIYQIPFDEVRVPFGHALTAQELAAYDGSNYTALLVNLHETSTGQLYDIQMISEYAKHNGLYLIVDAISTFLADSYDMDKYGIDCTIISSQKALALSPGISMIVMKHDFYQKKIKGKKPKSLYLNIEEHVKNMERGQTPNTPAVGIILELQERLHEIEALGSDEVQDRIMKKAVYFREQAKRHGLVVPAYPLSNALTPLYFENGGARQLYEYLKDTYGIYVTPCGGELADKLLRVGHLGNLTLEDYDELIHRMMEMNTGHQKRHMKAFLMAAGMGTRISSKTNEPKSLLDIGNGPLIRNTVKLLLRNHMDVNIILGYKGEMIKEALKDLPVTFFENPFYRETNSIASLWFAKEAITLDCDILLANADVYWQQDILDQLLAVEDEVVLLGDETRRLSGDYFFQCEGRSLIAYGKEMKEEDRTCEYVGIAKIKRSFLPKMLEQLNHLIQEGEYHLWWENTLYSLIDKEKIQVEDIQGKFWSEIDVYEDYERILNYVKEHHLR